MKYLPSQQKPSRLTSSSAKRSLAMRAALLTLAALFAFAWLACTTVAEDDTVSFKVQTPWLALDSFEVIWSDPQGNPKATLFAAPLANEASLTNLPGKGYQGEAAIFTLRGYENGVLVFEQKRIYDPNANPNLAITTVVELGTVPDPDPDPDPEPTESDSVKIAIDPRNLSLVVGETRSLQAKVTPKGTDSAATWEAVTPGIVEIMVNAATPWKAEIKGLTIGETWVRARSVADTQRIDSVRVEVFTLENAPPAITVFDPDTVVSIKDTVRFSASFEARTGNLASWSLDFNSDGMVDKQENVTTKTHGLNLAHAYADSGVYTAYLSVVDSAGRISRDSVKIGVRQDAPRVDAGRDTVIALGKELAFAGKAEQDFGTFKEYRWDFTGDGVWDFKSPTTGITSHTYTTEGNFEAVFEVEDDDGNVSRDKRRVDIGNKAPVFSGTLPDTVITIKDTLEFTGWVSDADGIIAKLEWDFTGTGVFAQATTPGLAQVDFAVKQVFNAPDTLKVVARATDNGGKSWDDTVEVRVLLDAPIVDAGSDVTVIAGNAVTLVGSASDGKGDIVATEWKIGTGAFLSRRLGDTTFTAPTTPQEIWAYFRATDDDGNRVTDSVKITVRASTNNLLQSLVVASVNPAGPISLTPSLFNSGVFTYSANVAHNISSVSITAATLDPNATLTVNGQPATSSSAQNVPLDTGANAIRIVVTAQDGATKETYTVTLTRAKDSNNNLSALSAGTVGLTPTQFDPAHTTYAGTVAANVSTVSITATTASANSKLTIKGQAATSAVPLSVTLITGSNAIPIVVTAQNGTTRTYTVTITKAQDADNNLSALSAGTVTLTPTPFSSATVAYTGTAASTATSVSITATVASATSRVTINGQAATSGTPLSVNLPTASTAIPIVVTAENGSTKTYTVTITKAADTNNYLSALSAGTVALTPSTFDQATLAYAGSVASNVSSVSITATLASSTATMTINSLATNTNIARSVTLIGGQNRIPIVVTAQSGATRTYTVTITRALDANNNLSDLVPSAGTFTDAFSPTTTTYDLVVPDATTSVRFTPTTAVTTSSITVNSAAVNSGAQSAAINATAGTMTPVTIVVTAQSGVTKTYTVRMHRGGWVQAGGTAGPAGGFGHALASDKINVWQIAREGTFAVARRLVGSSWNLITTFQGVSNPNVMDITSDGTELYVSYSNSTNGMQIFGYNGGAWGGHSFASVVTSKMAMGNGRLYMVYTSNTPAVGSLRVRTLSGTNWLDVGESILAAESGVTMVDIVVGSDGNPWIAHNAPGASGQVVRVRRWTGTTWTASGGGSMDALAGAAFSNFSLGLLGNQPYLAYGDGGVANRLSVRLVSTGALMGARGFTPTGLIVNASHLDGSTGSLVVAASLQNSGGSSFSGYAWRWSGSQWVMYGGGPASSGTSAGMSFTLHNGVPYLGQITAGGSLVHRYTTTAPQP